MLQTVALPPENSAGPTSSMEEKVQRIKEMLERETAIWQLKDAVRRQFCTDMKVVEGGLRARVDKLIRQSDLSQEIENQIYHLSRDKRYLKPPPGRLERPPGQPKERGDAGASEADDDTEEGGEEEQEEDVGGLRREDHDPLEHVHKARVRWEKNLNEELLSIAKERGEPLAGPRPRTSSSGSSSSGHADCGGGGQLGGSSTKLPVRFLFDSEDLLDALSHIDCGNFSPHMPKHSYWGMIKVQLRTPTMKELQQMFAELDPAQRHMGLDDKLEQGSSERFLSQRVALGKKVQQRAFVPLVRQYAKFGIPPSLRPALWRLMLGLPNDPHNEEEKVYFARLQDDVRRHKLVTDELLHIDVQNMADDHRYFPFEEVLENVILAFSRDPWVRKNAEVLVHKPLTGYACADQPKGVSVPPCGILPFRGFINYAAPICFMYEAQEPVYFLTRALFVRMWCKLNAIRSAPGQLLHLCKTFEDLLATHHPRLFFHLLRIGVNPLQLVMPWIQFGFVGYLEVDQVLLLWDRLLGYDNLFLLPVLAAALLIFRAQALFLAGDAAAVQDILSDGSRLKLVPLLQAFLFPYGPMPPPPQPQQGGSTTTPDGGNKA